MAEGSKIYLLYYSKEKSHPLHRPSGYDGIYVAICYELTNTSYTSDLTSE